jgi:hypothetical protein
MPAFNSPTLWRRLAIALAMLLAQTCAADEDLITTARARDDATVPYNLNFRKLFPKYVLILFPGGAGTVNPRIENGQLFYSYQNNFLLRAREFWVDDEFATIATNSTQSQERIQAVIDDLHRRFPAAQIYLIGTSRGTFDTMTLAGYLADKIAGEIHTSSMQAIASFDARQFANRHLVVHHRNDSCKSTPFYAAARSHEKYGNDFIAMEGGISTGDPCEPFAHHGYNGIERETVDAIKNWIKQGRAQ